MFQIMEKVRKTTLTFNKFKFKEKKVTIKKSQLKRK